MHAQTDPHTNPCLSNSRFTCAGSICDGSSIGISTDSNPHFLNCGNNFVLSLVNGEVNKNVLIPNLIVSGDVMPTPLPCEALCAGDSLFLRYAAAQTCKPWQ